MAFNIVFYTNSAEPNRVDKTSYLTQSQTLTGTLRESTSIVNPSITIQSSNVPRFNYAYIAQFHRYYFVTGITSVSKDIWQIDMRCDVLMSYKTGIGALSAVVGRQENDTNPDLIDSELPVEKEPEFNTLYIPSAAFNNEYTEEKPIYVLTVVGA